VWIPQVNPCCSSLKSSADDLRLDALVRKPVQGETAGDWLRFTAKSGGKTTRLSDATPALLTFSAAAGAD